MAVRRLETDVLDCDICKEECYSDCVNTLLKHTLEFAKRDGWHIGLKHICPKCWAKEDKRNELTLDALEEWKGTPEELGATLEVATCALPVLPSKGSMMAESDKKLRDEIWSARHRMRENPCLKALFDFEIIERRAGR